MVVKKISILEKTIESAVVKVAKKLGFSTYKFVSPSNKGVPDRIFITSSGKLFFIEFKTLKGYLTLLQSKEINKLQEYGQTVYVINNIEEGVKILNIIKANDNI